MGTDTIIKLIVERDNMHYDDAREIVETVVDMMLEDPDEAQDIFVDELGLEPDYIMEVDWY